MQKFGLGSALIQLNIFIKLLQKKKERLHISLNEQWKEVGKYISTFQPQIEMVSSITNNN